VGQKVTSTPGTKHK